MWACDCILLFLAPSVCLEVSKVPCTALMPSALLPVRQHTPLVPMPYSDKCTSPSLYRSLSSRPIEQERCLSIPHAHNGVALCRPMHPHGSQITASHSRAMHRHIEEYTLDKTGDSACRRGRSCCPDAFSPLAGCEKDLVNKKLVHTCYFVLKIRNLLLRVLNYQDPTKRV